MKQKDMYTLEELFDSLDISLAKLSKMANVNESTLSRIRDGYSARVETVNKLLKAFSEVYGIELSRNNVTGITLEDKKATRQKMLASKGVSENTEKTPVSIPVVPTTRAVPEKAEKRVYNRKQMDTGLPAGSILASKFAESHGIARPTFYGHMDVGLGPGLIGMSTDVIPQKDHVDYSERPKPSRPKEKERYLTSDQQKAAFEFWQRHDVDYSECNDIACWCHTLKQENK
jgi:transcriptional regulator with XRE-family HTH domain